MERLDTASRYLGLNMLWLASQLLLVTAPGGTRAMIETVHAWREEGDRPVVRTFLAALRRHGVRAWLEFWPFLLAATLLVVDFGVVARMGEQRTVLFPATVAIAIPVALLASNLQPALAGRGEPTARAGFAIAVREIVRAPLAAIGTTLIVALAVVAVGIQPLLLLVVPAVVARLILAFRGKLAPHTKENP